MFYTVFCLIPTLEHVLNNFLIGFAALLLVVTEVVISVVGGVVGVVEVIVAAFVAAVVVAVAIVQGEGDLFCVGIGLCVYMIDLIDFGRIGFAINISLRLAFERASPWGEVASQSDDGVH